jgi:hypothetical protein
VQLIAIGLQARIPMRMTGFPGVGCESAFSANWKV